MSATTKTKSAVTKSPASHPSTRVQSLDCLRAVACLLVILSHTQKISSPGGWSIGAYGVGLFCVLSGYLITSILLREEKSEGRIDPIRFLQRRCLRILPAYFALLVPCALLMRTGLFLKNHDQFVSQTLSEFPYFATFTHNLGDGIGVNHLWSISVEEQFYCFLPVLLMMTTSSAVRQVILLTLALLMMPFALLRSIDPYFCNAAFIALIIGTLLAMNFSQISTFLNRFNTNTIIASAAALATSSLLFKACPYGPLCSMAYVLVVWLAVSRFESPSVLQPIAYLGRISYGVYLVQMPICLVTYWCLNRFGLVQYVPLAFTINAAFSILLGAASWELFEKRILSYRGRLGQNWMGLTLAFLTPILLTVGVIFHLIQM